MSELRCERVKGGSGAEDWRQVHNEIIPTHLLSPQDVRERAGRHHLEVAYLGDAVVGCSTVRPPTAERPDTATVIARILPPYRRRGYGGELYARGVAVAREAGAVTLETAVPASNDDGLRFALGHGFTEVERYLLDGDTIPWIDLRLG
ncbi:MULTISPECIES: GNAT family N-acetyltransferase [Streptomyces]|uniref:Acetyltransferase n=2 Tax=Streptomyces TaxID=1883 RepID=A0A117IWK8_9ACTN|nr:MULTISPECIES: GNAT family N-acetyltransferase [Streptomyces]KUH38333.1 acetyltransferase [Streptomyces kanasensis]UUS32182.1 GNAT family N-acetyltransferase [Streptomyces changanensis]